MKLAICLLALLSIRPSGLPPNILVIRIDDARADDADARRPDGTLVLRNVQSQITAKGMKFTNNFASLSLCCPSRAAFYSGQYAHNNGVFGNDLPLGGAGRLDHANSLAAWMQTAGYYTAHIGKYMNVHSGVPLPEWNWWETRKDQANQGYYYNYLLNENGTFVNHGSSIRDYATDVFTQKTLAFLNSQPYGAQPFFLVLDYTAPHGGGGIVDGNGGLAQPAARHQNVFANVNFSWPPSFNEADVSDKPLGIQQLPSFDQTKIDGITIAHRMRLGSLLAVDEGVGQIMDSLQAHGLAENTYVIFLSDNGYMEGEHRIPGGKEQAYEESIRLPLSIRGPGVAQGAACSQLVGNIDMAPTILELAGGVAGHSIDGLSLVPTFSGGSIGRQDFLIEGYTYSVSPTSLKRTYTGLRTLDFIYVETDQNGNGVFEQGIDAQELYSMDGDPYQLESMHEDPVYSALIENFHQRLLALETCSGGGCQ